MAYVVTKLNNKKFTNGLTTFVSTAIPTYHPALLLANSYQLASDIIRYVVSRLVVASGNIVSDQLQVHTTGDGLAWDRNGIEWRGDHEGFSIFHDYEHIPGTFADQRVSLISARGWICQLTHSYRYGILTTRFQNSFSDGDSCRRTGMSSSACTTKSPAPTTCRI